jgi:cytochrome c biogenesis protein CcdA
VPRPRDEVAYTLELIAGMALIAVAALVWRHRDRLSERRLPAGRSEGRSSLLLGATITAVELPTAFPYFAVIAAIVGSGFGPARQLVLLVLFNVCFVLPLLGIVATLTFAGSHAERLLAVGRGFLQRHWPRVLSGVMLLAGLFVIALGATGFASGGHGHFGRFFRHVRRIIHP